MDCGEYLGVIYQIHDTRKETAYTSEILYEDLRIRLGIF